MRGDAKTGSALHGSPVQYEVRGLCMRLPHASMKCQSTLAYACSSYVEAMCLGTFPIGASASLPVPFPSIFSRIFPSDFSRMPPLSAFA